MKDVVLTEGVILAPHPDCLSPPLHPAINYVISDMSIPKCQFVYICPCVIPPPLLYLKLWRPNKIVLAVCSLIGHDGVQSLGSQQSQPGGDLGT